MDYPKRKIIKDYIYCPNCLSDDITYQNVEPPGTYPRTTPHGFKSYSSDYYYLCECDNCGWTGDSLNLLVKEEYINRKRMDLINKMI